MRFLLLLMLMTCAFVGMSQINFGVYRTPDGNTDYHHLVRNGSGAALYINQVSNDATIPILRLSSGTASANVDVKFTVENNGAVGIGTITPEAMLTVMGTGSMVGRYDPSKAYFQIKNGTASMLFDNNEIHTNEGLYLSSSFNHPTVFRNVSSTQAEELMRITPSGNIGIGSNDPLSKLTVLSSGTMASKFDPAKAYFQLSDDQITMLMDGNEITTNQLLAFGTAYDQPFIFQNVSATENEELIRITPDGRLGIGTTDPTVKFEVKGSNAQWIYVNQGTRGGLRIGSSDEDRVNVLYRDKSNDLVTLRAGHDHGELAFLAGGTDSERMRITQNGNIGIGTNAPNSKLSIYQSGTIGKVFDPSNAYLELTDGTISMLLDGNEIHSNQNLILGSAYSNDITFNNIDENGSDQLMVIKGNGRVGIGTNSPSTGFELKGSGAEWVYVNHSNVGGLRIASSDAGMLNVLYRDRSNDQVTLRAGHDHGSISFIAGGASAERMRINPDGGVGIGTQTTGAHKLAVEGSIGAREVAIEANVWPDYVFQADYDLRSLEEVDAFVAENGHLPEVPNEAEVIRDGVELGRMNEILLKKVEELTLYMIDQNKQLKTQIEENKSQQLLIEALQTELSDLKASLEE